MNVPVSIFNQANWTRKPIAVAVPVATSNDVELAVAIEVSHIAPFVRIDAENLNAEVFRRACYRQAGESTKKG
ncbi:hypothetical protein GCM10023155_45560 [Bremerella cremea]